MPAFAERSEVRGCSIPASSHITNLMATPKVRTFSADLPDRLSYYANMAKRRGVPKQINWYLREWMEACGLDGRGAQAKMMKLTGWSKATMSQLFNGTQDYSPKIIKEAALALNVEEFELLMPPAKAMALRRYRESAAEVVTFDDARGIAARLSAPKADTEERKKA
jgi:transcriptional regulator with XRE-family HTH domain